MNIFKLKPDEYLALKAWGEQISSSRKSEAEMSLQLENCRREFCYLFEINNEWYAAMHMEPFDTKKIVVASQERSIDEEHRTILKNVIERKIPLTTAYDISVVKEPD